MEIFIYEVSYMELVKLLLLLMVIGFFIKLLNRMLMYIIKNVNIEIKNKRLKYGILSRKDIAECNINEFEDLCREYVNVSKGIKNTTLLSEQSKGGVDIIGNEYGGLTYIRCVLKNMKESKEGIYSDEAWEEIDREELENFLGRMIQDGVKKGIVITNSDFSKEALEFISILNSNSKKYYIEAIDGYTFLEGVREIRETEYKDVLEYV